MREITEKELAQLSERKTVHEWLNLKGIPQEEFGKPICLLRRLSIALEINTPNKRLHWTLRLWAWMKNCVGLGSRQ